MPDSLMSGFRVVNGNVGFVFADRVDERVDLVEFAGLDEVPLPDVRAPG
jgi:hypothetical protein